MDAYAVLVATPDMALRRVWAVKDRLDWTADTYGRSKVWKNTREWTQASAPDIFSCTQVEIDCTR